MSTFTVLYIINHKSIRVFKYMLHLLQVIVHVLAIEITHNRSYYNNE